MNSLGERIARLRKQKEMTQEDLAGILGVSAQSVSKWENGATMPDIMLLPVLASTFGVSIDELFGRASLFNSVPVDEVFGFACENLKRTIVSSGNHGHTALKTLDTQLAEYNHALASDSRLRSVIMRHHGIVYYRNDIGGLLLRKPKGGWQSLLADQDAIQTISLLADPHFLKALYTVIKKGMTTFTIPSLCRAAGIDDSSTLEKTLSNSSLFTAKTIQVDGQDVTVYEIAWPGRLFLIFAIIGYAKEFFEYEDICYYYVGDPDFYQDGMSN